MFVFLNSSIVHVEKNSQTIPKDIWWRAPEHLPLRHHTVFSSSGTINEIDCLSFQIYTMHLCKYVFICNYVHTHT